MNVMTSGRLSFLEGVERLPLDEVNQRALDHDTWPVNNSSFSDYCKQSDLPLSSGGLRAIVEGAIGKNPHNIGLDLAGGRNGRALQELLADGLIGKALLTTYMDRRDKAAIENGDMDHIAGDLIETATWEKILDWQHNNAPDGFSLVMHRPCGPLQDLSPEVYIEAGHLLLDMTAPNGVLFTQIPTALGCEEEGRHLREACASISERPDVKSIIVPDEILLFSAAVIVKA